ncbi:hypothetical protein [Streptomyces candidus]|uniref:Uncharacterized protein n=1 Tax=Streptomyces candidus TaxID=67283 RepID=A0A7X0LP40_9ACTN|nr:hypothetical protein [Streptomyces candidus]GHH47078.1 hypothetical protein GCM10018773_39110 [Streptomyces candidus]
MQRCAVHDWAERGQNAASALLSVVALLARSWQAWSRYAAIGLVS